MMELPLELRQAVDAALAGASIADLAATAKGLSQRYRDEVRDGRLHIADERLALAYIATRLPATYAAVHAALSALAFQHPDIAPRTLLDVGAGPGTVMWAATSLWPGLESATLVETSAPIRALGERLAAGAGLPRMTWRTEDLRTGITDIPHDVVTIAYVLDELAPRDRGDLINRLWAQTRVALLVVEPGTTAGWQRILAARDQLVATGAHILAPCPHAVACPIAQPDWCHFSARVARSRIHRLVKQAEVPWEDEKFVYLAASREPATRHVARVLAPPEGASGRVRLKLCQPDGTAAYRLVTRREGETFKRARRIDWGDVFES